MSGFDFRDMMGGAGAQLSDKRRPLTEREKEAARLVYQALLAISLQKASVNPVAVLSGVMIQVVQTLHSAVHANPDAAEAVRSLAATVEFLEDMIAANPRRGA